MRLSPSPLAQAVSPSLQSTAISGIPLHGHSLPTRLQRANRNQDNACLPSCGICLTYYLLYPLLRFSYVFKSLPTIYVLMTVFLCCIMH